MGAGGQRRRIDVRAQSQGRARPAYRDPLDRVVVLLPQKMGEPGDRPVRSHDDLHYLDGGLDIVVRPGEGLSDQALAGPGMQFVDVARRGRRGGFLLADGVGKPVVACCEVAGKQGVPAVLTRQDVDVAMARADKEGLADVVV